MAESDSRALLLKYGSPKLARYLSRSIDDFHDISETVYKQVLQNVESGDLIPLLQRIECYAMALPGTFSSIIFGFNLPRLLLEGQKKRNQLVRQPSFEDDGLYKPTISYQQSYTVVSCEVKNLYDIYRFHRYLKQWISTKVEGLKLVASKRKAKFEVTKLDGQTSNFSLSIQFAGTLFLEQFRDQQSAHK